MIPGSARVSPQQSFEKVRDGEDAIAIARDARSTQQIPFRAPSTD